MAKEQNILKLVYQSNLFILKSTLVLTTLSTEKNKFKAGVEEKKKH